MIIEAFILSMLIGFIRGGKLRNLNRMPLRHANLFAIPLFLFIGAYITAWAVGESAGVYIKAMNIAHYITLPIVLILNLHIWEMWPAAIGTLCNSLVLAVNGGVMPMSVKALKTAGMERLLQPGYPMVRHSIMSPETKLKALADIIGIPGPSFLPGALADQIRQVMSVGDLLLAVAVFILIQNYMCSSGKEKA